MKPDPQSFRDPQAQVLRSPDGRILRALTAKAAERDDRFRSQGLIDSLVRAGLLVESWRPTDLACPDGLAAVVESRRVRFPSYPYEWSFAMLQDAALLTLRLARRLCESGGTLRDASAYNVLFDGARPVFIDVMSPGDAQDGEPWVAYGQFCDHFLAPLLIEACRGVPFQPLLRSSLEGVSIVDQLPRMMRLRDVLKPGVLVHVMLRALVERRARNMTTPERVRVRRLRLSREALLAQLAALERVVARLRSRMPSVWARYETFAPYTDVALEEKAQFVEASCRRAGGGACAWDVGANTGRFSRVLARHFERVLALDIDAGAVDGLYRAVRGTVDGGRILPLVLDFANPSPSQGWAGQERSTLLDRARPSLATYLALVHHLCLGRGIPIALFAEQVARVSPHAVIEFVAADDPMAQALLATRNEFHPNYDRDGLRSALLRRGRILAELELSHTRTLLHFVATP